MLPFNLFLVLLSCISSLDPFIRLTPKTNQDSLIWCWRSSGLLSAVVLHAGTERAEHIQIITTSAQEMNNVIPNKVRLLV